MGNCIISGSSSGGITTELVWTNPNPNSTLADQKIQMDLSKYSFIYIIYKPKHDCVFHVGKLWKMLLNGRLEAPYIGTSNVYDVFGRDFYVEPDGITLGQGYGTTTSNLCIPYQIWGIK